MRSMTRASGAYAQTVETLRFEPSTFASDTNHTVVAKLTKSLLHGAAA
jgi:hypothetical protein